MILKKENDFFNVAFILKQSQSPIRPLLKLFIFLFNLMEGISFNRNLLFYLVGNFFKIR